MYLSKSEIQHILGIKELKITPIKPEMFKASSYTFTNSTSLEIQPKQFIIIDSAEHIEFSKNIGGVLSTRGSIAKLGLDCLMTDTIIEPGSEGKLTFCTVNHSDKIVTLEAGTPIVKCLFYRIDL